MNIFERLLLPEINREDELAASYFVYFTRICISLLVIYSIHNIIIRFHIALAIDTIGITLYSIALYLFRRNLDINKACGFFVLNCCFILLSQSVILEFNAYHNMFFYPPLAIFCFALFSKKNYALFFFGLTSITALLSYFVPKYFDTTLVYLSEAEKDSYVILTIIASLAATFKVGEILFKQKEATLRKLKESNAKLDQLNLKNKKILQLIIHDISAPLQKIDFILNSNKHQDIDPVKLIIQKSTPAIDTIKQIINTSREMMAIEDGKIKLNLIPVDLLSTIKKAQEFHQDDLAKKNISIVVENNLNCPAFVLADEKSLKASVLSNVISNSIKFSHRNSTIRLEILEDNDQIILNVHDQGIGIPASLVTKIFNAEEVTSRIGTEGERGTGYGLPLVKAFIRSYQGDIHCESAENAGTTVRLTFKKATPST